ncbi:MAG: hypothetical protein Q9172_003558 [Xanthocarpia lactea]
MTSPNPPSTPKHTVQLRELITRKFKGQHSFTREAGLNPKALNVVIMWEQEPMVRTSREWRQARIRMGICLNGNGEPSKSVIKPDVIKLKELVWEGRQSETLDEWRVFVEESIGLPEWEYEFVKWDLVSSKEKRKLRTRRKRLLKKLARKADVAVDNSRPADEDAAGDVIDFSIVPGMDSAEKRYCLEDDGGERGKDSGSDGGNSNGTYGGPPEPVGRLIPGIDGGGPEPMSPDMYSDSPEPILRLDQDSQASGNG